MSHARTYGDACGTMREEFRRVLRGHSYVPVEPHTEKLVEDLLAKLHDTSIEWALRSIVDRPETRK